MKTALTLLFLTAAIIGCSAEQDPVADVSQAYMFAIEPCESTFQGKIVKWVTIGSSSSSTVTKIRVAYNSTDPVAPNYTRTLTAQVIPTSGATPTTGCWDRFPSQIPESWTSDSQNPPGTSGYYIGTYPNNEFVDIYGSGGVVNNDPWNPASWVRVVVAVSSWGVYVQHRWLMNASDPYTWTQEY
jgi:hypothetical protein